VSLRILIADDHAMLREGLTLLINAQPDMEVVAQAGSGREACQLAEKTTPDVAVLDVSMPHMGGAEAAREILARCSETRVLALTRHSDEGYVRNLLAAGATGYVLKQSAADTLVQAIRTVAQGGTYLEPSLAGGIVERAIGGRSSADALSDREQEVLRGIAWGRSNKEIAAELGLSVKTVESYKATATHKLALRTRTQIIRYALARGWLNEDSASG
jgi:two-component system, NarL family, response regulator NreC